MPTVVLEPAGSGDVARPYDEVAVRASLARVAEALDWADTTSPFGRLVPPGSRVVVKPNWVMHANKGPWGLEPLVTHASVIRSVCEALLRTGLGELTVGDAPLQSCDFAALLRATSLDSWAEEVARRDSRFRGIEDFRRTRSEQRGGVLVQREGQVPLDDFVRFDLGGESLLEPVSRPLDRFRVTQYRPGLMSQTHAPGRHQYLVARRVIDADLIVNLPKLKTHKKAGITNALKNLIGINGNKEYLPHHRVGGAAAGGDCYPGRSVLKRLMERLLDAQNSAGLLWGRRALAVPIRGLSLASRLAVDRLGVEGSWSGNDTIWRTCLDLNRILVYGRADGSLADRAQRKVVHVMDAVVAGQGDGPLAPEPFALGLLGGSEDPAALDWVGATLLGYRPDLIATVRQAFGRFRWRISSGSAGEVRVMDGKRQAPDLARLPVPVRYPLGWVDAVDRLRRRAIQVEGVVFGGAAAQARLPDEEA
jgi:uncharacterized protein (DUF362 family)